MAEYTFKDLKSKTAAQLKEIAKGIMRFQRFITVFFKFTNLLFDSRFIKTLNMMMFKCINSECFTNRFD